MVRSSGPQSACGACPGHRPVGVVADPLSSAAGVDSQGQDQAHRGQAQGQQGRGGQVDSLRIGIPKNKSTSNLAFVPPDNAEKARVRMSFDAGATASDASFSR